MENLRKFEITHKEVSLGGSPKKVNRNIDMTDKNINTTMRVKNANTEMKKIPSEMEVAPRYNWLHC